MTPEYQSAADAAKRLGVCRARMTRLLRDGRIPGAVKGGRDWLVPIDAVPTRGFPGRPVTEAPETSSDTDTPGPVRRRRARQ